MRLTDRAGESLLALLVGAVFLGSGGARLGLSQKGDLPSSGEREHLIFPWSKVAGARNSYAERPRLLGNQGLPRPWGQGGEFP